MKFQACFGPSANKVHIREGEHLMTCCERTSYVRDVTGSVRAEWLCVHCIFAMARRIRHEEAAHHMDAIILAQRIGVDRITP